MQLEFPYKIDEPGPTRTHWHTFIAGGLQFAQVRCIHPGEANCSGLLNKLYVLEFDIWRLIWANDPLIKAFPRSTSLYSKGAQCFIVDGECHLQQE